MNAIANRYAEALFNLAIEEKQVDTYFSDIKLIQDVFSNDQMFVKFFNHGLINDEDKNQLIDENLKEEVNEYVLNFLKLLIKKRRINYILDICNSFRELCNNYYGIEEGLLYVNFSISSEQIKDIEEAVGKEVNKKVILKVVNDPTIIGGIKVVLNNQVIDNSINNKLDLLKRELLKK